MNLAEAFGQLLRDYRRQAKLSQEELGFRSNFHRTYISMLERGLRNPTIDCLFRLCAVLEVKPEVLVAHLRSRIEGQNETSNLSELPQNT